VSRCLTINIEGKIGQLTVRRTSSFISRNKTVKIKDNNLTGHNYERNKKYVP
jgi:hypothetical protein